MIGPRFRSALVSCLLAALSVPVILFGEDKLPEPKPSDPKPLEVYTERVPDRKSTVTFDMVRVPGGPITIKVGDEEKQFDVKPFWIGKTEVRWDEYDVFFEGNDLPSAVGAEPVVHMKLMDAMRPPNAKTRPSKPYGKVPDDDFGHAGYPLIRAHYNAAATYCQWLSKQTGKKYRLPTEAEWELACRAGGDGAKLPPDKLDEVAWYRENAKPDGAEDVQTHPVGKKSPNAYGLHDMLGNVAEWVVAADATDRTPEDERYVIKGGGFHSGPGAMHPAFRQKFSSVWQAQDSQDPKSRFWLSDANFIGFRVVRED